MSDMLRLTSNYESRSRYRHGRLPGRRSRALQHAHGADDRARADGKRTGVSGRHHAADREFASRQARGRRVCKACLDWSERRHHLAGTLGAAVMSRFTELNWAARDSAPGSRVVNFTRTGEKKFAALFGASEV